MDELGVDSLGVVEAVMELEEEFDLSISEESAEGIQTIGDIVRYMSSSPLSRANAEAHRITWAEVTNFVNRNP